MLTTKQRKSIILEFHHLWMRTCQEALYEADTQHYIDMQNKCNANHPTYA